MRTYRIQLNERAYTASVEQTGEDVFKVTIDGEVFESESLRRDSISTWLVRSTNDEIRAQTRVLPADKVDVWLAGTPFQASVQVVGTGGYAIPTPGIGEQRISGDIRAPMPGRITSILIREGESVDLGTPLLILEAMKMQNELTSPTAGHVKSIHVQEGATVKKDSLLIVVE
ncbi:MAG: biotin/lipoyl-containing protein [Candidatus Bathyarchaeia archaeon]|jgi:pyruvate carboxylase subunit B